MVTCIVCVIFKNRGRWAGGGGSRRPSWEIFRQGPARRVERAIGPFPLGENFWEKICKIRKKYGFISKIVIKVAEIWWIFLEWEKGHKIYYAPSFSKSWVRHWPLVISINISHDIWILFYRWLKVEPSTTYIFSWRRKFDLNRANCGKMI